MTFIQVCIFCDGLQNETPHQGIQQLASFVVGHKLLFGCHKRLIDLWSRHLEDHLCMLRHLGQGSNLDFHPAKAEVLFVFLI